MATDKDGAREARNILMDKEKAKITGFR